MTKEVVLGNYKRVPPPFPRTQSKSNSIPCPALGCNETFLHRAHWSGHCAAHARKGELVQFIENPQTDIQWQRYSYKLPEKEEKK